jgi:hypothetical protein
MSQHPESGTSNQAVGESAARLVLAGQVATGAMALALILPWQGVVVKSRSYVGVCVLAVEVLSKTPNGASRLGWSELVLLACLAGPALAVLVAGGAALRSRGKAEDRKNVWGGYTAGGLAGLAGALGFCCFCGQSAAFSSEALGIGFYLFALASLTATVVGFTGSSAEKAGR